MISNLQVAAPSITSVNPATGEVLREFPSASDAEVCDIVSRARIAQISWNEKGLPQRLAILRNFQRILVEKKQQVGRLISTEAGKPYVEALTTEILVVLDAARFCVQSAQAFLGDEALPHGNLAMKTKSGKIVREPYGVIGIISPWNYPFSIPAIEALAALVTGNAVVIKPSEFTSLIALELESLLHEAGVPQDVLRVIVGDGGTGAALMNSDINKLIFTGSVATGKKIAQAAASRLLPVALELGGKDPMIVLDDADVEIASSGAVWGAFMNAGQTCLSVERCYVHRAIYDKFIDACVKKAKLLRIGNGLDPATDVGPMIHERQLRIVEAQVEEAKAHGAEVLAGGSRLPELGPNFYTPTILAKVDHAMRIMREESFGPVLPIMAFDSEDEAVQLANDSEYGLAASVWTRNKARGERIARRLAAGTVMINDVISCFGISEAPHGGVKASGIGRTHGRFGMEEMVWVKYVDTDRIPGRKKIWWYGYSDRLARQMEGFLNLQFAHGLGRRVAGALKSLGSLTRKDLR